MNHQAEQGTSMESVQPHIGASWVPMIQNRMEFRSTFDRVYMTPSRKNALKAIVILTAIDPSSISSIVQVRKSLSKRYEVSVTKLENGLYKLRLVRFIRQKTVSLQFIVEWNRSGYWVVYTDASSYLVTHVLETFLNKLYPHVSRTFFNHLQIREFLRNLEQEYRGDSIVTSVALERQQKGEHQTKQGTLQFWEADAEKELDALARQYFIWVHQVGFEIKDQTGVLLLSGCLSARGVAMLHYGHFSDFAEKFVRILAGVALRWETFYTGRERMSSEMGIQLKPYAIRYPFQLEKRQIGEINHKLSNAYSLIIIHDGNPYYAASLCDFMDGSSFGLTVHAETITITPLTKATPFALWRLAATIQDVVGEGDIRNIQ